jgi:metallo-beta-lactamase family protein
MKITFCGAAGTVTGSCHLITLDDGRKILFDCGLYQGYDIDMENFNETWKFDPKDIDYLILSHAHIDHSGRIPKLVKDGFKGPIVSTYATRDLATIMLMDSAFIQMKDAEYKNKKEAKKKIKSTKSHKPLYDIDDAERTMNQFVSIGYGEWYDVGPGLRLLFRDSGHILGSASITLKVKTEDRTQTIGFTGDIGRPSRPILRDPEPMPHVDHLICESTYGGKTHDAPPEEKDGLLDIIRQTCIENKGRLIIPAFSVGRTQELVYMMDQLVTENNFPDIPVYVDSPLAVNATDIFKTHPECYDREILTYLLTDPDPFGWSKLKYVRKVEDSKAINDLKGPCIIISASGMITAGRILHHVRNNVHDPRNTILIVGYCAEGSIGAQLAQGAETIRIYGEEHKVLARIAKMHSFSAHGDQPEMIEYLDNQSREKLKCIYLVHGEVNRQEVFKTELLAKGFKKVVIPKLGEAFEIE